MFVSDIELNVQRLNTNLKLPIQICGNWTLLSLLSSFSPMPINIKRQKFDVLLKEKEKDIEVMMILTNNWLC